MLTNKWMPSGGLNFRLLPFCLFNGRRKPRLYRENANANQFIKDHIWKRRCCIDGFLNWTCWWKQYSWERHRLFGPFCGKDERRREILPNGQRNKDVKQIANMAAIDDENWDVKHWIFVFWRHHQMPIGSLLKDHLCQRGFHRIARLPARSTINGCVWG